MVIIVMGGATLAAILSRCAGFECPDRGSDLWRLSASLDPGAAPSDASTGMDETAPAAIP
jgi:hypothetical protein